MALADSWSAFEQKCQEIDSSGDLFRALDAQNTETFSPLAFVSGSSQHPMNRDDFSRLSAQVFEDGAELGVAVKLRRLPCEAAKRVNADLMRNSAEDQAPPRFKTQGPSKPEEFGPRQLQTPTKQRICYEYNLARGCSSATSRNPKQRATGVHVCAKCHKEDHSLVDGLND